ncbi:uncharacterized protein LOC123867112 [Maniola jurtina]|uniref:uncharacterized protein LOC123867112 n=1 Tax=Maniola jurtina TaxID=191418 RepID=UPI001E68B249|nr:uncharacterized protein LOC123867112 [Maniola jurtina]
MEHNINGTSNDKKCLNKAKSQSSGQAKKVACEPAKHNSFITNQAVRSLDVALGRLKKSKLVNGEYKTSTSHASPSRSRTDDMFIDTIDSLTSPSGNMSDLENTSLISMNFSHYELIRNVSQTNCNSDGAFSNTTSDIFSSLSDITLRNEQLERYFRSAEIWRRNRRDAGSNSIQDGLRDK